LNLSGEDTRQLLRSSAALAPAGLVAQLTLLTDALAVASFSGPHAAGLYNLGKRARLALQLGLSSALDRVSLPTFARVRADKELLSRTLETALRLSTIVVFPVFVGAGAIAPELVAMFLGPDWAGAALSMTLLLVAGAIAMTTHYFDNILLILERRRWIVTLRLAMLFALVLLLATFGRLGPAHVASAALVSTALHNFTAFWVVSREARVPVRVYLETVLLPLAISISMLALLTLLRDIASVAALGPIVRMALFIVLGAAVYIGFAWFLARRSVQQLISAARNVLTTRPSTSEAT
jgi:teichuronic acid exporter